MAAKSKKSASKPAHRPIQKITDELGQADSQLRAALAPVAVLQTNYKSLLTELLEALALSPDQAGVGEGSFFLVTVGEQANERTIVDMPGLFKMLGPEAFYEHCKFPLGVLDKLLAEEKRGKVLKTERTGNRTVKVIPRAAAAKG